MACEKITVWLSPEMVDFEKRLEVKINGRRTNLPIPATAAAEEKRARDREVERVQFEENRKGLAKREVDLEAHRLST